MSFGAVLLLAVSLTDLSWMAGHWGGTVDGVQMEEVWLAPRGKVMPSVHRDVRPDGRTSFEFARIAVTNSGIVFFAQPNGKAETPFALVESTKQRAVFENLEHDFPQRIIYWRDGDQLCARVEGRINGKEESEEWCWSRSKS